jgi:hypothetical protein
MNNKLMKDNPVEVTDEKAALIENLVMHVMDQMPDALQVALPALNAHPNDPRVLLLTIMAALMDRKPDHALRFLHRFTKNWRSVEKVADLKQKYDLRVNIEPVQTLELISQVQRVSLVIKRRKGERKLALDWNPIGRQLDPLPCEWNFVAEGARVICDDQLHIVSPAGHEPCPQCGKEYCGSVRRAVARNAAGKRGNCR